MDEGKKRKSYIKPKYPNKRTNYKVEVGNKGFLCSCNFNEKACIKEAYNILNEYADKLYVKNEKTSKVTDELEIEDALLEEINEARVNKGERFQVVESGAKNFLFIRTNVKEPVNLATNIVEHLSQTCQQQTKALLRLIPVEIVCKAYIDNIKKAFEPLLDKYFSSESRTFNISFNHRNNGTLSKDETINELAKMISDKNSEHRVNLTSAEVSVIVEVIRSFAFIAVIPNYIKYKKFNLLAICNADSKNLEHDKVENTNEFSEETK